MKYLESGSTVELIARIRTALADPTAPWYGSELVVWVDDALDRLTAELEQLREQRDVAMVRAGAIRN